jgi:hypothetical protein
MPKTIPDNYLDLFQKKAFANLATLMPDGSPQVTPVWCDYDGENVLINTAAGRVKDKNLQREPRVSLSILDIATSRFAGESSNAPTKAPTTTSTGWPRNTWAWMSIPIAVKAKCVYFTRSSLTAPALVDKAAL